MKKKFFAIIAMLAVIFGFASCDKKDKEEIIESNPLKEETTTKLTTINVEFEESYTWFYGTDHGHGTRTNNFILYFQADDIIFEDEYGHFSSRNIYIAISLYNDRKETGYFIDEYYITDKVPSLDEGVYTLSADEDYPAGSFSVVEWIDADDYEDEDSVITHNLKEGIVVIKANRDIYDIKINIVDSLGNTLIGTYNGKLDVYDRREDPFYGDSFYGEQTQIHEFTLENREEIRNSYIEVYNYGERYYSEGVDSLVIKIPSSYIRGIFGNISLSIYVPNGIDTLPVGEYKFLNSYSDGTTFEKEELHILESGELYYDKSQQLVRGQIHGSYAILHYGGLYWLTDGILNISKTKDDIYGDRCYTISGTLISHYGSKINVNYSGLILYSKEYYDPEDSDENGQINIGPK